MKYLSVFSCMAIGLSASFSYAESPNTKAVEREKIIIKVPADWKPREVQEPLVHVLNDPTNQQAVAVIREVKVDMGVGNLQEYFEFKLEKVSASWDSPKLDAAQSSTLNGKQARTITGSAILVDPKGIKIPSKILLATVEGKDYYYLIFMSGRTGPGKTPESILQEILNSFEAP